MKKCTTEILSNLGINVPKILLPKAEVDMSKWAVVACDQYTSEPDYWKKVATLTQNAPSTLNIVFPEAYLENGEEECRIENINQTMDQYISEGILNELNNSFVLIDRKTSHADSRKGLIVAVDLECYDYTKGSKTLIRATEGTVIERLPPRIKIRQNAPIELPHIMVLIDDPDRTVIEPLFEKVDKLECLYDFELMMNGGHITGYKISDDNDMESITKALESLACSDSFSQKYNISKEHDLLLFAVGDGNHSLASAKGHWENVKKELSSAEQISNPARYALVELVNVHDEGLMFEPIHRILFNVDEQDLLKEFSNFYGATDSLNCNCLDEKADTMENKRCIQQHTFRYVTALGEGTISIDNPINNLEVGTLQVFLDEYMKNHPEVKIDYIHGEDVVAKLGAQSGNIGFYLPPMDKNDLFKTVILDGALPRKTFSMGEAEEKRFYLECRKIRE